MGARLDPTNREIKEALQHFYGAVGPAAARLGMSTRTLQRRIEESPSLSESAYHARETLVDYAEGALRQLCLTGHWRSMIYYLETHARDRGYGLRKVTTAVAAPEVDVTLTKDFARFVKNLEAQAQRIEADRCDA